MPHWQLQTPVAFFIFNRPETTARVFEAIRQARPPMLLVVADGPRSDHPDDVEKCAAARSVIDRVDWDCEVLTNFSDTNMGCKRRISSGLDWVFSIVEAAIILEDDCLPGMDFFRFCDELLVRYAHDTRIGMISGNNFGFKLYDNTLSYCFSKHGLIWGWATWKRAWQKYHDVKCLSEEELQLIKSNISDNQEFVNTWWEGAQAALQGKLDTWDYLWGVARYANNFLTIRPKVNLVANIGFGETATRTKGRPNPQYLDIGKLEFPLTHPKIVVPDPIADKMLEDMFVSIGKLGVSHKMKTWAKYGIRTCLSIKSWITSAGNKR